MKYPYFENKLLFVLEQDSYNINRCATISCYSDTKIAAYCTSDGISHWSLVSNGLHRWISRKSSYLRIQLTWFLVVTALGYTALCSGRQELCLTLMKSVKWVVFLLIAEQLWMLPWIRMVDRRGQSVYIFLWSCLAWLHRSRSFESGLKL
jgi:hypothetical protein